MPSNSRNPRRRRADRLPATPALQWLAQSRQRRQPSRDLRIVRWGRPRPYAARANRVGKRRIRGQLAALASEGKRTISCRTNTATSVTISFPRALPWRFPHNDAKSWFEGAEAALGARANSALQGDYLIVAARALGRDWTSRGRLDGVTKTFFADSRRPRRLDRFDGYGDTRPSSRSSPRTISSTSTDSERTADAARC